MKKADMTTPHEATQAPDEKHSPLPWHVGDHDDGDRRKVESSDGFVANCALLNLSTGERSGSANAVFIVTAVNAYDALIQQRAELLKALQSVEDVTRFNCGGHFEIPSPDWCDVLMNVRLAIANAERGQ
jgi:hypothetical protein